MAQQKEIISTINGLIETLKDGQEGFKQAAEAVKDTSLKSLFTEFSQQRARFATELQTEAMKLGEPEPEEDSSASGALHRAWINIKSAITSGDDHAILAECERGEDSAVNEYQEAIKEDISSPIRGLIERQYRDVKNAHDRIKSLRDAAKTS
ncbi:MAG TPA: PA2169 family four-helix-bundle protein [Chthoniobacterales bacterium]|nr:PA2169 family four-helix-bundle protein [Chthoniobacterales bacterium]